MERILFIVIFFILLGSAIDSSPAFAEERNERFGSLRKDIVNVRAGPGKQYPILWVFKQRMYPVEILAEYQSWYKIRDPEGEEGWVYNKLISQNRTALVSGKKPVPMFKKKNSTHPLYKLEPGVILGLNFCTDFLCQVYLDRTKGWVNKDNLAMAGR